MLSKNFIMLSGLSLLLGFSSANAAIISTACDAGDVSGASGCEISDWNNDSAGVVDNFFDISTWEFAGKVEKVSGEGEPGSQNVGFYATGVTSESGTWGLDISAWGLWDDIMLAFKDGADTTLVGFKLGDSEVSGSWASPFYSPNFNVGNSAVNNVSHISVYVSNRPAPTPVSAPATIMLMGLGIAGLGIAARRRKA